MSQTSVTVRKDVLTPRSRRELYFATYHQAAHAVTAVALGCRIDFVEIGVDDAEIGWSLDTASMGDVETICAAGFAMEKLLDRLPEHAWSHSKVDRDLLGALHAERTGLTMNEQVLSERFLEGALWATAMLNHQAIRAAIDLLAEALSDSFDAGTSRVSGADVHAIVGPSMGSFRAS